MVWVIFADLLIVADEHGSALAKESSLLPHATAKRLLLDLRLKEIESVLTRARLIVQTLPLLVHMQAAQMPLAHMRGVVASTLEQLGNSRR